MNNLNYHHLRYFFSIVEAGTLTEAARRLHVSQSSVSIQLRQLEENLDCALFDRQHKSLHLTEEGRIVFDYAKTIFQTGDELIATLNNRSRLYASTFRVGAVATLSRNFQIALLRSLIRDDRVEVIIHSASKGELLEQLRAHTLDVVLANRPAPEEGNRPLRNHRLAEQPVSLIGQPELALPNDFQFPNSLNRFPLILPSRANDIGIQFDHIMEQAGIRPLVAAEADDMTTLRLLAREMSVMALIPPVVVKDELVTGQLRDWIKIPNLRENFYAITQPRRYPSPFLEEILQRAGQEGLTS